MNRLSRRTGGKGVGSMERAPGKPSKSDRIGPTSPTPKSVAPIKTTRGVSRGPATQPVMPKRPAASAGRGTAMGKEDRQGPVKPRTKAYAKGGSVRGTGCATKGKTKVKTY